MARMRIMANALRQLQKDDPETAITMSGLRRLVNAKVIPAIRVGRKTLINYDQLLSYLSTPDADIMPPQQGQIRKVY
jgi:excisionase family DNA binding protein